MGAMVPMLLAQPPGPQNRAHRATRSLAPGYTRALPGPLPGAVTVVLRPGTVLDPADLARHCAHELPAFAVPRYIEPVPALPLTETGKVRKAVLRERGVTAATWDLTDSRPWAGR